MSARIATSIAVNALIRRVAAAGGNAAVIARGDDTAGAILLILAERGRPHRLVERALQHDGAYRWAVTGPKLPENLAEISDFLNRRRRGDPDLWVVELDIPDAERFADEMVIAG